MFHSILVALDSSARAAGVLRVATEVAERFDASMRVLRAIAVQQDFPAAAARLGPEDPLPAYLRLEATMQIDQLVRGNARASKEPPIVVFGSAPRVIVDTADEIGADLIVIGSHGFHGWDHLFGTVAQRVANRAHRHVLVVHEPDAPA